MEPQKKTYRPLPYGTTGIRTIRADYAGLDNQPNNVIMVATTRITTTPTPTQTATQIIDETTETLTGEKLGYIDSPWYGQPPEKDY